jgi:hypothetical protein
VTFVALGKTEVIVIGIGFIIGAAGLIMLLPSAPIGYETNVNLEPGSYRFLGTLDGADDFNIHSIRVQANPVSMHIILRCGGNDFDLYAGFGYTPTTTDYEFRGYEVGGEEFTIYTIEEGIWHMMVQSYSGAGQYELRINIEY